LKQLIQKNDSFLLFKQGSQGMLLKMRCSYEIVGEYGAKMSRFRTMNKKVIELFDEKTGFVIRTICFYNAKEFDKFVKDFKAMRYPGYGWRYRDKEKKKNKHE
jgi:hypothetical protein